MTVADAVRSLRRMRIAHPRLAPPPIGVGDLDWQPDAKVRLIARELAGEEAEAKRDTAGRSDLRGLVSASQHLGEALGDLVEQCGQFTPLRLSALPEVPPHHQEHVCTADDLAMLYIEEGHKYTRSARSVSHPGDVCEIASRLNVQPQAVLECLARFSWLGFTVPDADDVDRWLRLPDSAYQVLRTFSDPARKLDWAATIVLAQQWEVPVVEAEDELVDLAEQAGLEYSRWLEAETGDVVPSSATSELVTRAYERGALVTHGFGIEELATSMPYDLDRDEIPDVVEELREMGISVPDDVSLLIEWPRLPVRSRYVFSGIEPIVDESDFPTDPTKCVLFTASAELRESLGEVWKLARSEAARLGLSVPTLPKSLTSHRPTFDEIAAVVDSGNYEQTPVWKPLSAYGLAQFAHDAELSSGEAYERLTALRPLGALVPELPPDARKILKKSFPDKRDLLALEGTHRVTDPDEPLVALDLVSVAARLGEPVSRTWQRFVPYLPLAPKPAVSNFPDVIPLWQDLAILSKYLDGLLPAIEGRVDGAHVAFVAGEVGESGQWVWERLTLYATMFELDLSDMPEET